MKSAFAAAILLLGCALTAAAGEGVVVVEEPGVAGVALADLQAARAPGDPDGWRVTLAGERLPWDIVDGLLVFPVPRPGTVRIRPGAETASVVDNLHVAGTPAAAAPQVRRFERNAFFDRLETARLELMDVTDPPFYWLAIRGRAEAAIDAPGWGRGARVRVRLQSQRTPGVPHRIAVLLNGAALGTAVWEGGAPHTAEFVVGPAHVAGAGAAWVFEFVTEDPPVPRVIASGPIGDGPPAFLDWIELEGLRALDPGQASWVGDGSPVDACSATAGAAARTIVFSVTEGRIRGVAPVAHAGPMMASSPAALRRPALRILAAEPPPAPVEWLAIGPERFRDALAPLVEHRRAQGLSARFVALEELSRLAPDAPDRVAAIDRLAEDLAAADGRTRLRFLLLVGDACRGGGPADIVPAPLVDALGGGWTATDGLYARIGAGERPDIAVGRWPARTAAEAAALLEKVKRIENAPAGEWKRRIHLVLGSAGFGEAMDSMLKTGGMKLAGDLVPEAWSFRAQSSLQLGLPFTWPHDDYNRKLTECVNEGCLLFAYSGHGFETGLQSLRWKDGRYPILDRDLAAKLNSAEGAPFAFLFACLTGSFDEPEGDCLAEALVRNPRGPAAAVASSAISHPYADMIFAKELMQVMFAKRAPTIGQAVAAAKRRAVQPAEGDTLRMFLDGPLSIFHWDKIHAF